MIIICLTFVVPIKPERSLSSEKGGLNIGKKKVRQKPFYYHSVLYFKIPSDGLEVPC